ncbi:FAD/FMN-containing dehydrogenase [Aspergillus undulatus]|uniref:FAD/FMN-containing dehydrogenase n=1 Tax=Aspergillus undulatus TaxID=1810928 RepID=UPI003CCDC366
MIGSMASMRAALFSLLALNSSGALAHRWWNWQNDITCESTAYFVPEDEADLISFVKEQYPRKTMLRPVGNGHGFGNLTTCVNDGETDRDSYILSLTNLKHLKVGENNTVTVGGGWDLIDLMPELHERGLQVRNLGSEKVQNYIGAATTGTHGTGKDNQNLATQIIGMRILDAQGTIHTITKEKNPELLQAFAVSIGAMGIIVEVTLQTEPTSYMKRTSKVVELSSNITELYQEIAGFAEQYDQVNILGPHLDWDADKQELVLIPEATLVYWEPTEFNAVQNCSLDYCANDCGRCDRNYICYDTKMDAIATPPPGICYRGFMGQFEHFLPIEYLADAGVDYLKHAKSQEKRLAPYIAAQGGGVEGDASAGYVSDDVTVITRFIKADNAWLSPHNKYSLPANSSGVFAALEYSWIPAYNNFTLQWFHQELASEFIPAFGEEYNVRPHWNKMLFNNGTYSETIYPKMNEWLEVQERMDPNCQFVNPFIVESLGIDRCSGLFA